MPEILGPTNPVPGYDPTPVRVTTPAAGDNTIQNIVNPEVVVRPDRRSDQEQSGTDPGSSFAARYDSNFMTFIQRLRGMPNLGGIFLSILQEAGVRVSSGITDGFAAELGQFLDFIKMDEAQLDAFLKNQLQSASRFNGPLFQLLRNAYNGTQSELVRNDILQFLRRYSDYTSTGHLESKMTRTVSEMGKSLPSQWADRITELLAQLQNGVAAGDREGNLKLLREQLFPMMARYVSMTHDHGRARSLLSTLTLDMARYENGSESALLAALRHLSASKVLPGSLANIPDQELLRLLRETDFAKASRDNAFADRLADAADRALQGEGGVHTQEAFRNILSSILLNESVFMPLAHVMLPVQWNDKLMFSELWVDPDAERDGERGSPGGGKTLRMLIKMDVQFLGAFDVIVNARDKNVVLQLACPEQVAVFSKEITAAMNDILKRNGLQPSTIQVAAMRRPVAISEVFPKLFERGFGVNVKI